jgi:mRNA interferase MazF
VIRGSLVTVALQGDYGKPRPALVIQSDFFSELPSVTILPITSEYRDAPLYRVNVLPTPASGLRKPSQIMIDKAQTVSRDKIGDVFGQLSDDTMLAVNRALALFLGFA